MASVTATVDTRKLGGEIETKTFEIHPDAANRPEVVKLTDLQSHGYSLTTVIEDHNTATLFFAQEGGEPVTSVTGALFILLSSEDAFFTIVAALIDQTYALVHTEVPGHDEPWGPSSSLDNPDADVRIESNVPFTPYDNEGRD